MSNELEAEAAQLRNDVTATLTAYAARMPAVTGQIDAVLAETREINAELARRTRAGVRVVSAPGSLDARQVQNLTDALVATQAQSAATSKAATDLGQLLGRALSVIRVQADALAAPERIESERRRSEAQAAADKAAEPARIQAEQTRRLAEAIIAERRRLGYPVDDAA